MSQDMQIGQYIPSNTMAPYVTMQGILFNGCFYFACFHLISFLNAFKSDKLNSISTNISIDIREQ